MTRTFRFEVQMACEGCASAVKKALAPMNDLRSVETSVDEQTVTLTAVEEITMEEVGNKIKSSGKVVKDSRILRVDVCSGRWMFTPIAARLRVVFFCARVGAVQSCVLFQSNRKLSSYLSQAGRPSICLNDHSVIVYPYHGGG
ncbi:hypothetical protein GE09DRAFT_981466 [Coniochaeta sp. 2T2.1]|nr:hypothetical protein GE09DRAFT_981466 [Coniochaeta sp. 2T2.1]